MKYILTSIMMMLYLSAFGQEKDSLQTDTIKTQNLSDVTITSRRTGTRKMGGAVNGVMINKEELFKAALPTTAVQNRIQKSGGRHCVRLHMTCF